VRSLGPRGLITAGRIGANGRRDGSGHLWRRRAGFVRAGSADATKRRGHLGAAGRGVEPGETWEQAAVRECREETGWDVRVDGLLGVYSDPTTQIHHYPDGRTVHCVGVVFLGSPLSQWAPADDEASQLGWFPLDALPEPIFAPDIPVLRHVGQAEGHPFID
jgi:8-oxo-dGTP pyrophosphatase MutT (NUDIX family)